MSVNFNGTEYFYTSNIQGDVTGIVNSNGMTVVTYTYDAWGRQLSCTGSMAGTLGVINPLRYRGYVYDQESGLYYLQSRYYNPDLGKFINADNYISTGQGFLGKNMFAYCLNNPVCYRDDGGTMADSYAGYAAEETAKFLYELFTGREHPSRQTEQIEIEIIQEQIEIAKDVGRGISAVGKELWSLYMDWYMLEQESITRQAEMNIDMFDSPEDIEQSIDIAGATVGFSVAAYEFASITTAANPPTGAIVWTAIGVAWAIRGIVRSCQ